MNRITTTPATRRNRSVLAGAAIAFVLLPGLLAGCSTRSGDESTGPTAGSARQGATLAECMRGKGYDMPDPSSGDRTMELSAPDGVDQDQYQNDLEECLDDAGGAGEAQAAKPMEGGAEMLRQSAACIRERGFSDYPDDEEGMRAYQPDDQDAFDEVAKVCDEMAFGSDLSGSGE